jgi:cyclophilin family peptidyl-prolyl cis-trans isomerase
VTALALLVAALLAIGAWAAFGDVWSRPDPPAPAGGTAAEGGDGPAGAAGAPIPEGTGPAEGASPDADAEVAFEPVPYLSETPVQRFEAAEAVLEPGRDYRAAIETTAGRIVVDLYETRVPRTVGNFVFLALHRFYEGVPFHRVIDGFMAQTGDPTGTGRGGPGYRFDDEIVEGLVHDRAGLLSMANAGPDTNGSQFFLTFAATPWLDGRHAVFGEVLEGMEVLDRLTRVDPQAPTVMARLSEPAATLAEQGVAEAEGAEGSVEAWLRERLGALPDEGQSFQLDGRRGVLGSVSGAPAVGLFPVPDRIERVTVLARPQEDSS